jgi:hypothetical protein
MRQQLSNCYFFFCYYSPFIVKFSLMPVCLVKQMRLSCGRASRNIVSYCFEMRSSLVSSRRRDSSFWMCHFTLFIIFNSNLLILTIAGRCRHRLFCCLYPLTVFHVVDSFASGNPLLLPRLPHLPPPRSLPPPPLKN